MSLDEGLFAQEQGEPEVVSTHKTYKILLADDDKEVHSVSKLLLRNFTFDGATLELLDTFSAGETKRVLKEHDDIAVVFLDVVMESPDAGLQVVEYLREELQNSFTRIILRTGQPGEAPEDEIIKKYDINDYRLKTELTVKRLKTSLYSALRSYRDLMMVHRQQKGLERIIKASSTLFTNNTLNEFLNSMLDELRSFQIEDNEMVFLRSEGFISMQESGCSRVVAATGVFEPYVGKAVDSIPELSDIYGQLGCSNDDSFEDGEIQKLEKGFLLCCRSRRNSGNYIYIQGDSKAYNFNLIKLFLSNFSQALDHFLNHYQYLQDQKDFLYSLSDSLENRLPGTGNHVQRVARMMRNFGLVRGFSYIEAKDLELASIAHDLGKIRMNEDILQKEGPLSPGELEEMEKHPQWGAAILRRSGLPLMREAAELALTHHEKFDGTGYPQGLQGQHIPLKGRMLALADVYDALTHDRYYAKGASREEAVAFILEEKGKSFDPQLAQEFVDNLDKIMEGSEL